MSIPKICPLIAVDGPVHMSKCRTDACAWWDYLAGACCMASGADYLRAVSDSLEDLTQKKTAQGAANTPDGKVEKVLAGSDSTSNDTKETEGFQA